MLKIKFYISIITLMFSANISAQVSGYVFEDTNRNGNFDAGENGLSDVLVSNGIDIVKTDSNGKYTIKTLQHNPLFVIKPKGYISPINKDKIVVFFINPPLVNSNDVHFPLLKNKEQNTPRGVILGDPQVDVIDDVHHVGKLVTEELAAEIFDFMIPVGDLSFDNLDIFPDLSKTLGALGKPVFYTIGNHDIDFSKSFNNVNEKYEAHFGPSYYAFQYGNEDFLVLNNIFPLKNGKYKGKINEAQYKFIDTYLRHKKNIEKLTIFMHIPLEDMVDKNEFLKKFEKLKFVFIVAGHHHTQYYSKISRGKTEPIVELVAGAVCGSWWQGPHDIQGIPFSMMHDGTEKGYWFGKFTPQKNLYTYKVSGSPSSKQMNIWTPEVKGWSKELNELNEPFIYANVFSADENTEVSISFDNKKTWMSMNKYNGISPYLKRLHFLQQKGKYESLGISKISSLGLKSKHLWRIPIPENLPKGTYVIAVKAYNKQIGLNTINYKVFWNK